MNTPTLTASAAQRISDFQQRMNEAQAVIRAAGDKAWLNVTSTSEVGALQQFLAAPDCGTHFLNATLAGTLSEDSRVVKFASVFVHNTPKVRGWTEQPGGTRTPLPSTCELGDLQTLFVYLDKDKTVLQLRSVIFQAKKEAKNSGSVISDKIQRDLYDRCDGFTYTTPAELKGQERRLPPAHGRDRIRALQHLFVIERPVRTHTLPSDIDQGAFQTYGEHLLRFLNDSTGLAVDLPTDPQPSGAPDPWTQIVQDLMREMAHKIVDETSKKNPHTAANPHPSRGQGLDVPEFRKVLDRFNSFESHEVYHLGPRKGDGAEDGGFGVQLIIIWDAALSAEGGHGAFPEPPAQPGPPDDAMARLLKVIFLYATRHIADRTERISFKDELAHEMHKLIVDFDLDRDVILAKARALLPQDPRSQTLLQNALATALGTAAQHSPQKGDVERLIALLPNITWEHSVKPVLNALIKISEQEMLDPSLRDELATALNTVKKRFAVSRNGGPSVERHILALIETLEEICHTQTEIEAEAHAHTQQQDRLFEA